LFGLYLWLGMYHESECMDRIIVQKACKELGQHWLLQNPRNRGLFKHISQKLRRGRHKFMWFDFLAYVHRQKSRYSFKLWGINFGGNHSYPNCKHTKSLRWQPCFSLTNSTSRHTHTHTHTCRNAKQENYDSGYIQLKAPHPTTRIGPSPSLHHWPPQKFYSSNSSTPHDSGLVINQIRQ